MLDHADNCNRNIYKSISQSNLINSECSLVVFLSARKKQSSASSPDTTTSMSGASKKFWGGVGGDTSLIDANIENISANMNRVDSERLLAAATKKLAAAAADGYFSSEESNDESLSLVIDHPENA